LTLVSGLSKKLLSISTKTHPNFAVHFRIFSRFIALKTKQDILPPLPKGRWPKAGGVFNPVWPKAGGVIC
jgi:hypothetical protein